MKRFFLFLLTAIMAFSLFSACGGDETKEKKLSPYESLMAKYSEIANEQTALSESIAKKGDMTLSGKNSRLAIDLTDIATELAKKGEEITEEEIAVLDARLTKCKETLTEIKKLLEK